MKNFILLLLLLTGFVGCDTYNTSNIYQNEQNESGDGGTAADLLASPDATHERPDLLPAFCAIVHNIDGIGADVTTNGQPVFTIDPASPNGEVGSKTRVEGLRIEALANSGPDCKNVEIQRMQIAVRYSDTANTGWYPKNLIAFNWNYAAVVSNGNSGAVNTYDHLVVFELNDPFTIETGELNRIGFMIDMDGAAPGDWIQMSLVGFVGWQAWGDNSSVHTVDGLPINGFTRYLPENSIQSQKDCEPTFWLTGTSPSGKAYPAGTFDVLHIGVTTPLGCDVDILNIGMRVEYTNNNSDWSPARLLINNRTTGALIRSDLGAVGPSYMTQYTAEAITVAGGSNTVLMLRVDIGAGGPSINDVITASTTNNVYWRISGIGNYQSGGNNLPITGNTMHF